MIMCLHTTVTIHPLPLYANFIKGPILHMVNFSLYIQKFGHYEIYHCNYIFKSFYAPQNKNCSLSTIVIYCHGFTFSLWSNIYYLPKLHVNMTFHSKQILQNIFACLFSVHNIIGLSRHE